MTLSDDHAKKAEMEICGGYPETAEVYATLALVEAVNDLRVMLEKRLIGS